MSEDTTKKPADWRNTALLGLGAWLFISPGFLGFNSVQSATLATAILGGIVLVLGGLASRRPLKPVLWALVASGAWLIVSPFALGFAGEVSPMWNSVTCGLVCVALSGWQFFMPQLRMPSLAR